MPKIEIEIGGDNSELERKIKESEALIKNIEKEKEVKLKIGGDITGLENRLSRAKQTLSSFTNSVQDSVKNVSNLSEESNITANSFDNLSNSGKGIGSSLGVVSGALLGVSKSSQSTDDVIEETAESVLGMGGDFAGIAASMMGPAGITLAITLAAAAFTYLTKEVEDLKQTNLNAAFESDKVLKATENVSRLTNEVDLAKNGFLDKEKVIKDYNDTMGKTTGIVSTLDGVEQALVKNGPAYIEMTLLKTAADIARQESAAKSLKAAQDEKKSAQSFLSTWDYVKGALTSTAGIQNIGQSLSLIGLKNQDESIKESKSLSEQNLKIAEEFNKKAAEIAKKNKFNFFEDNEVDKNKAKKAKELKVKVPIIPFKTTLQATDLVDIAGIEVFNGQVGMFGEKLKGLPGIIKTGMIEARAAVESETIRMGELLSNFNENAKVIIQGNIAETFGMLGTSIGEALATGGDVLGAIGATILQGLTNFLSDMGSELIKYGTLAVIKGNLDLAIATGGPAAIAAGIAAIGVGIALKAAAGAIGAKAKGGKSGASSTSTGGNSYQSSGGSNSGFSSNNGSGTVVFRIAGQDLIGVLSNTLDKNSRLGGAITI